METIDSKNLDSRFKYDVTAHPGGENIKLCFACGTCTAGCPVSEIDSEFNPRKIIRQVLLGMRKQVLSSPVIWRCVQCYSCTDKCPQNVKFRDIMKALRQMAVDEGHVEAALAKDIENLGTFAHQTRRDLVNILLDDRTRFDKIKQKLKDAIDSK